jgi:hypothetical protein
MLHFQSFRGHQRSHPCRVRQECDKTLLFCGKMRRALDSRLRAVFDVRHWKSHVPALVSHVIDFECCVTWLTGGTYPR